VQFESLIELFGSSHLSFYFKLDLKILSSLKKIYRILYGSYATFAEADKAKQEIRNTINPDAWILIESLTSPK
jgi:hypothetical protein